MCVNYQFLATLNYQKTAIEGEQLHEISLLRKTISNVLNLIKKTACKLYSNLTGRSNGGISTRVRGGSLAKAGEFPWMVRHITLFLQ